MKRPALTGTRAALRRHLLLTVTSAVAVVAVAATAAAESAADAVIRHRVAKAAPGLGDAVTVGVGGDWALWDLAHGSIPRLDVGSDDARVGRLSGVRVRARLDDVRLDGRATVGGTRAEVTVSPGAIAGAIRAAAPSVAVASVTADPAAGTVLAAVGPGGAGQLTLRPALADGKVTLAVDGLTVFGRSVPAGRLGLDRLAPGPDAGRAYPLGLRATSADVRPDGLHVSLEGGPGPLPAA
ncbi:LmeA family phospholipid-binding protein [Streptomyces lavendulae]|uniref:LmeA family phospholipid-binding protein n=1 Tax=Streptomyces lavendulae TaxID=1914 RepID=UPI0033E05DE2